MLLNLILTVISYSCVMPPLGKLDTVMYRMQFYQENQGVYFCYPWDSSKCVMPPSSEIDTATYRELIYSKNPKAVFCYRWEITLRKRELWRRAVKFVEEVDKFGWEDAESHLPE